VLESTLYVASPPPFAAPADGGGGEFLSFLISLFSSFLPSFLCCA
jgi:hypothetical protein